MGSMQLGKGNFYTPSQGCSSPWTWHLPTCTMCLVAKVSDLLMDKSVSTVRQQACLPAALPACWQDRMYCRDQPSNADMKSEGSASRPGTGLVEGSDMALTLERQAQTLPTPITHSHTFTSPPEISPLSLPTPSNPLLQLHSTARSSAEPQH